MLLIGQVSDYAVYTLATVLLRVVGVVAGLYLVSLSAGLWRVALYEKAHDLERLKLRIGVRSRLPLDRQLGPGLLICTGGGLLIWSSLWGIFPPGIEDTRGAVQKAATNDSANEDPCCPNDPKAPKKPPKNSKGSLISVSNIIHEAASDGWTLRDVTPVIGLFTLIVTLVSIRSQIARWKTEQRRRFESEKTNRTESLSSGWNETILDNQKEIEECGVGGRIGPEMAREIAYAVPWGGPEQMRRYRVQAAVIRLMNTFEALILLYDLKLLDMDLVDRTMARAVTVRYRRIRQVAIELEKKARAFRWADVHRVVREWEREQPWLYFECATGDGELSVVHDGHERARRLLLQKGWLRIHGSDGEVAENQKEMQVRLAELSVTLERNVPWLVARLGDRRDTFDASEIKKVFGEVDTSQLAEWFQWHDGSRDDRAYLLPTYRPLSNSQAIDDWKARQGRIYVSARRRDSIRILGGQQGDGFYVDLGRPWPRVFRQKSEDSPPVDYGLFTEFVGFLHEVHHANLAQEAANGSVEYELQRYRDVEARYLDRIATGAGENAAR